MGMFDSIMLDIKCPYCKKVSEIECQTKIFDCSLEVWKKGDYVGTKQYNHVNTIADCLSPECKQYQIKELGYSSGFGRMFTVQVKLEEGIVTGEYEVFTDDGEMGTED